jgi:hypothetical protein
MLAIRYWMLDKKIDEVPESSIQNLASYEQ